MTISKIENYWSYTADDIQTTFQFKNKIYNPTDIKVWLLENGVETPQTLNVDYTVSYVSGADEGDVIFTLAPAFPKKVILKIELPLTQNNVLPEQGAVPVKPLEETNDRAVLITQQLQEQLDRSLLFPISSLLRNLQLPAPEAGKALGWGPGGASVVNLTATGLPGTWPALAGKPVVTVGDVGYETFRAAVIALNAAGAPVRLDLPPGIHEVAGSNLTTNANIEVYPLFGANITVADARVCTINRLSPATGLYQWITTSGTGKLVFGAGAVSEVYHQWWGGQVDLVTESSAAVKAAGDAAFAAQLPLVFAGGGYCLINTQCKWGNTTEQVSQFIHIKFLGDSRILTTNTAIDGVLCFEGPNPEVDIGGRHNGGVLIENPRIIGSGGSNSRGIKFYGIQGTIVEGGIVYGLGDAIWSSNHDLADFLRINLIGNVNGIVSDDSASAILATGMANSWNLIGLRAHDNSGVAVNIFGGYNVKVADSNFVNNYRDVVLANHATLQPILTKPVLSNNYHEGNAGGDFHIVLGGGAASGLIRGGAFEKLMFLPGSTRTKCISYTTGCVDQASSFRNITNTLPGSVGTYDKIGDSTNPNIYDDIETDYSNDSTIVGFSSIATKEIYYIREGRKIRYWGYISGASNATNFTFTLPYTRKTGPTVMNHFARIRDNGVWGGASGHAGLNGIAADSNVVSIEIDQAGGGFTASGTKSGAFSGWYYLK